MAELLLVKALGVLKPLDEQSTEYVRKLAQGELVNARITKPRNPKFHRKFFAMLNLGFDNQDVYWNRDHFRRAILIEAGHFEDLRLLDGTVIREAKSLRFDRMDELEFGQVYWDCLRVLRDFLDTDDRALQDALEAFEWQQ